MKHTIERIDSCHYKLDNNIVIAYVEQLGNDNGWCVFDKDTYYQKVYDDFENALLIAMDQPIRHKRVLPPPAGFERGE